MTQADRLMRLNKHPSYANSAHRKRARDYLDLFETVFTGLSRAQLNYIAMVSTDQRLDADSRRMLVCLAVRAGPDLKRPVPEEELLRSLNEAVAGAQRVLLEMIPAEGRA